MDIDTIAMKLREKLASSGFDRSVRFDLGADGVILADGADVKTEDGPADCTIAIAKSDFEEMLSGELNPTSAFMQGKLKVDGDMSVAMSLSSML